MSEALKRRVPDARARVASPPGHRIGRVGWLRAAVLGANDGVISTSSLLRQLRLYPLDGLGSALTGGLLSVLPVGFLGWVPSRALLGVDARPLSLWITPIAAVGFVLIAVSIFKKGLIHYGRSGSQRYLPHGHRD